MRRSDSLQKKLVFGSSQGNRLPVAEKLINENYLKASYYSFPQLDNELRSWKPLCHHSAERCYIRYPDEVKNLREFYTSIDNDEQNLFWASLIIQYCVKSNSTLGIPVTTLFFLFVFCLLRNEPCIKLSCAENECSLIVQQPNNSEKTFATFHVELFTDLKEYFATNCSRHIIARCENSFYAIEPKVYQDEILLSFQEISRPDDAFRFENGLMAKVIKWFFPE